MSVTHQSFQSLYSELEGLDVEGLDFNMKDENGYTLLHACCMLQYHTLAHFLVTHGADPNIKDDFGNTPFQLAMKNMDQKMIKILVEYVDRQQHHSRSSSLDGITDTLDELGLQLKAEDAATTIQSAYRGYKVREELDEERAAAMKIQQFYRAHRRRFWDKLESAASKPSRMNVKQQSRSMENEAAKKIQSAFKTYRNRKETSQTESTKRRTNLVASKRR